MAEEKAKIEEAERLRKIEQLRIEKEKREQQRKEFLAEKEHEVEQMRQRLGTFLLPFVWPNLTSNDPKSRLLDEKNKIEQDRAEQEKLMADKEAELRLHEAKIAQVGKHHFQFSKLLRFWVRYFHLI